MLIVVRERGLLVERLDLLGNVSGIPNAIVWPEQLRDSVGYREDMPTRAASEAWAVAVQSIPATPTELGDDSRKFFVEQ